MKIKTTKKIGFRMTIYCVVFAFLLTLMVGGLGVYNYYQNSVEHYKNYLIALLNIASESMDMEEMERTIRLSEQNEGYLEAQILFNHMKNHTDIEYLYLVEKMSDGSYEYILCAYGEEELKNPDTLVRFRDTLGDEVEYVMVETFDRMLAGEENDQMVLNNSDLGYFMSLIVPVKSGQGEILGLLTADIRVDDVVQDVMRYVFNILLGAIIAMLVFLMIFLLAVKKSIITPIVTIGRHANEFVSQTDEKPSEMKVTPIEIHTGDELGLLSGQLNTMMKDMVEYMSGLESMTSIQERMNVQLDLVKQIQQSMLPDTFPAFPERTEFDIYASVNPAGNVGGDFYDFFLVDGTHLGVVIADVSGEGVPGALFMMRIKTLIKNYAALMLEPAKVLFETNNELCESNDAGMTAEALMGILDVYSGEFLYAVAGMNHPYVIGSEGEVKEVLVDQGFLLGMLSNIPFYQERIYLKKQEVLCLFTNGVFRILEDAGEKVDKEKVNKEKVDEEKLDGEKVDKEISDGEKDEGRKSEGKKMDMKQVLEDCDGKGYGVREVVEKVESEVLLTCGDSKRSEDLTMMAVRFEGYVI